MFGVGDDGNDFSRLKHTFQRAGYALSPYVNHRNLLVYLFFLALLLRVTYLALEYGQLSSEEIMTLYPDGERYINIGRGLLEGHIEDENAVLIFGPGYGFFLGLMFFLFGIGPKATLVLQVLLSSASCLLLYALAGNLTGSRAAGLGAGLLLAVSFTSISLASAILSDTLFFFLFLLGNLLFLKGLQRDNLPLYVLSGLLLGYAIWVRSIGQFWPLAMIIICLLFNLLRKDMPWRSRIIRTGRGLVAVALALAIVGTWVVRNYSKHDLAMLAYTSAGGPARVAGETLKRLDGDQADTTYIRLETEYRREHGIESLSYIDSYRVSNAFTRTVLSRHAGAMLRTYFDLVWENVNNFNEMFYAQLPKYMEALRNLKWWYLERSYHELHFWLTLAGLAMLLVWRKWMAFLFTSLEFFYFVLMVGFTRWQGSRLFYPGQIAVSIAIAFLCIGSVLMLYRFVGFIRSVILYYLSDRFAR
jgi:4-amino-4-deoxy-L-arabinose transferase-like glycosyltransferase